MGIAQRLLLEARRATGLSQAALARKARLPRSVLNVYERGKREPRADTLAAILGVAGFELRLVPRTKRAAADDSFVDWIGASLEQRGAALVDLLGLADRLPKPPKGPLRFPRLSPASTRR
jgi:transcriptional regulator with XRE-family HTH domain